MFEKLVVTPLCEQRRITEDAVVLKRPVRLMGDEIEVPGANVPRLKGKPQSLFALAQRLFDLFTFRDVFGDRQMLRTPADRIVKRHGMGFHPPAGSFDALNFELERSRRASDHVPMHTHECLAMLRQHQIEYRATHHLLLTVAGQRFLQPARNALDAFDKAIRLLCSKGWLMLYQLILNL